MIARGVLVMWKQRSMSWPSRVDLSGGMWSLDVLSLDVARAWESWEIHRSLYRGRAFPHSLCIVYDFVALSRVELVN